MLANGKIVDVYEDPLTMVRKEGTAKIVGHVVELEPGVGQYLVNFIGDDPSMKVVRIIAEHPLCSCCDPMHAGDNPNCRVHGRKKLC